MKQYLLMAAAALLFAAGWVANGWRHAALELAVQKGAQAATEASVAAIKGNRPIFQTINRTLEKELRSEVRYTSPDCSHTPESWRVLDAAYQAAGGEPFDRGAGVSAAPATTGRDAGRDDTRAGTGVADDR